MQMASHARRLAAVMGAVIGVAAIRVTPVHADAAAACRGGPVKAKTPAERAFERRLGDLNPGWA
jgi:hypothetical protein